MLHDIQVNILERASSNRDEGYGLDLDEWGQEAMIRAGLWDKFWDVSRKRSDEWKVYGTFILFEDWILKVGHLLRVFYLSRMTTVI